MFEILNSDSDKKNCRSTYMFLCVSFKSNKMNARKKRKNKA